jgi:hypothetical protein
MMPMPEDPHIEAAYVACDIERMALRAMVERLEGALGMIADVVDCWQHAPAIMVVKVRQIARAALKEPE